MSKIHLLTKINGGYEVAIHRNVPAGDNSAGKSWKACWLEFSKTIVVSDAGVKTIVPVTSNLIEGTNPGNITTAELADVEAGDLVEIIVTVQPGAISLSALNEVVDNAIAEHDAYIASALDWYGYEIAS